ncbi:MAG TPA: alcohol dehydrogenase catalytic domain-containing protein, partial [Candidatus Limnocylindria bacterium]|nr:alcohol dehydrogenase catalytic domain-containing protein [Candidatus Limnocylindria bacterium]
MKAIQVRQFGEPSVLEYMDLPEPVPGKGQVRVALMAAGVNPVDAYIRAGGYAAYEPPLPWIPGFDGAGVVDAVGAGVTGL